MARYTCPACGYVYDEETGAPREGYPAGTRWESLPEDFACPDCAVRYKDDFVEEQASDEPATGAQGSLA
ncbi:MAG TPA: rubredoxin [Noviherbaspirillum sp.]|nr:rubredoxin [Noviherbaspirillum sp.]